MRVGVKKAVTWKIRTEGKIDEDKNPNKKKRKKKERSKSTNCVNSLAV